MTDINRGPENIKRVTPNSKENQVRATYSLFMSILYPYLHNKLDNKQTD